MRQGWRQKELYPDAFAEPASRHTSSPAVIISVCVFHFIFECVICGHIDATGRWNASVYLHRHSRLLEEKQIPPLNFTFTFFQFFLPVCLLWHRSSVVLLKMLASCHGAEGQQRNTGKWFCQSGPRPACLWFWFDRPAVHTKQSFTIIWCRRRIVTDDWLTRIITDGWSTIPVVSYSLWFPDMRNQLLWLTVHVLTVLSPLSMQLSY